MDKSAMRRRQLWKKEGLAPSQASRAKAMAYTPEVAQAIQRWQLRRTIRQMQSLQEEIEILILATPSGDKRNEITAINIGILESIRVLNMQLL